MVEREPAYLRAEGESANAQSTDIGASGDQDLGADAAASEDRAAATPTADGEPRRKADAERPRPASPKASSNDARRRAAERRGAPVFYAAGFIRRFAAGVIDLAIILPVALFAGWFVGWIAGVHLPKSRHHGIDFWLDLVLASDPALLGALGLTLAIALVYAFVFQLTTARTLGMRALKIRIIDAYGDAPSPSRIIGRTAGYLLSTATLFLGFLWIGFDAEKRGLHDWVSGTYVVKG